MFFLLCQRWRRFFWWWPWNHFWCNPFSSSWTVLIVWHRGQDLFNLTEKVFFTLHNHAFSTIIVLLDNSLDNSLENCLDDSLDHSLNNSLDNSVDHSLDSSLDCSLDDSLNDSLDNSWKRFSRQFLVNCVKDLLIDFWIFF